MASSISRQQARDRSPGLPRTLYTADVRFIFELLQNADDNQFFSAKADDEAPYLSFAFYETASSSIATKMFSPRPTCGPFALVLLAGVN
ncbi:hypothetical protein B0T24DRAFT_617004 [Lasiosphaeria ovina]|uniref:Uncharacterized protein n=1 Tax=Lasiosphaeria ovina TaxID=92902 RepID=A0AAE0KGX6_9PEZI|nr:hypothetical protein B0T24DRAFT_617004 [Lasiosphaeria ovina]